MRPMIRHCITIFVLALWCAVPASARAGLITVFSDFGAGNSYDTTTADPIGNIGVNSAYAAQFTTSSGPQVTLASISVALGQIGATGGLVSISLAGDNGGSPGTILETLQAAVPTDFFSGGSVVTVNSASMPALSANTQYWIEVTAVDSTQTFGWFFNNQGVSGNVAQSSDGGATYSVGPDTDPAFSVNGNAVPEPASLALMCAGLGSVLVWRRFQRPKR